MFSGSWRIFWHPWDPWGHVNSGDIWVLRFFLIILRRWRHLADFSLVWKCCPMSALWSRKLVICWMTEGWAGQSEVYSYFGNYSSLNVICQCTCLYFCPKIYMYFQLKNNFILKNDEKNENRLFLGIIVDQRYFGC